MTTCYDLARHRLKDRPIKESTYKEYLATVRVLGLADVDADDLSMAMVTARLAKVLNQNTRRKHSINLRAALGLQLPCPRATSTIHALPEQEAIHQALARSSYAMWGWVMLYAGLRVGEACTNQRLEGNTLMVDRQRLPDGTLATAKTTGPVVLPGWLAEAYSAHDFTRSANTVYVGIVRAGKKSGLSLRPHMLRHAFATNLVKAGASPEVLRRQMRHHDVSVSLRYYVQTTEQDIADVVSRLTNNS